MRKILFLSILIGLTGCANLNVSTNTQNFSAPDGITKNDSIFIEPIRNDKYQELERLSWSNRLSTELKKKGYKIVDSIKESNILIIVGFDIDGGTTTPYSFSLPQYGVVGYSGSITNGTANTFGNTTNFSSYTTNIPQYGVSGYNNISGYSTTYRRIGTVMGYRRTDQGPKNVYSGKVTSSGSCGILSVMSSIMMRPLVEHFPEPGTFVNNYSLGDHC